MKVSVIGGAGTLGATSAFVIAQQRLADEICLIDLKENLAKSHEMDMGQAAAAFSNVNITSGGMERLEGSDIVILTAGTPESQISSRMELLDGNLAIVNRMIGPLRRWSPSAILITATNPVDVINAYLAQQGFETRKLIGFTLNDTFRFRWAIANVLGVDFSSVEALVVGEHGEAQCPLYSSVSVDGKRRELSGEEKRIVDDTVHRWFLEYQALQSGRTSGWLSAVNIARLVAAIVKDTKEVLPCSVVDGEGVSIGRPVILGKSGVDSVVEMQMTAGETERWNAARKKIAKAVSVFSA